MEKNAASSGYKVGFKQLQVLATTYEEQTIQYTYDNLSRLIEADYDSGSTVYTYGYDLAGNLVNMDGVSRTFNAANQMTNDGTNSLTYDNNGNLTDDGVNEYTWDRVNRLLEVDNGTPAELTAYAYDGVGNRIAQAIGTSSPVVTQYLLDTQPGLAKVIAATTGGNTDRYVHGPRGIHTMENNAGNWTWAVQDAQGSVRAEVDHMLAVQASRHLDPYLNPFGEQGSFAMPFVGTGEMRDPIGLQYHRARYYNPAMGGWLSLDPFEGMAGRPMSLNGYGWVEGRVINAVDPTGRQIEGICGIGAGACVGAAAIPIDGPIGEFVLCGGTVLCIMATLGVTAAVAISMVADEVAEATGLMLAEAERIVEDAFRRHESPDNEPEQQPERTPVPIPLPTPDNEDCPTNHPPGSMEPFDTSREMEDVMCNIKKRTAFAVGPQPFDWWLMVQGGVNPIFGNAWMGIQAAFVGRNPTTFSEVRTNPTDLGRPRQVRASLGSLLIPRPGFQNRTRADIMAFVVHELRHAGQYYNLFESERIRGQRLVCPSITGRIAEVDAWMNTNHWVVRGTQAGLLALPDFNDAKDYYNGGILWTEDSLWNHPSITQYRSPYRYGAAFDIPPLYTCPGSQNNVGSSC